MPYAIHNTVRSTKSRTERAKAPEHARLVQRIGERRVLRGRPLVLPDADFAASLREIQRKAALGHIEVKTLDGRRIDPATLDVDAPPPPHARPEPPLDSIARDAPWGERMPSYAGDDEFGGPGADLPALVRAATPAADGVDSELSDGARARRGKTGGKR